MGHLVPGFAPETALERMLAQDRELWAGLAWGRPRPGHPEGAVGRHVAEILPRIAEPAGVRRRELRFMALVHDACKFRVRPEVGRVPDNDHTVLARRLAGRYTDDPRVLDALEHHDTWYRIWRRRSRRDDGRPELHRLLDALPDLDLYLRFVELDGATAGKDPAPLAWLRSATRPSGGWTPRPRAAARSLRASQRCRQDAGARGIRSAG
jgi:hypothetical protein